jgi:hypothetical protein
MEIRSWAGTQPHFRVWKYWKEKEIPRLFWCHQGRAIENLGGSEEQSCVSTVVIVSERKTDRGRRGPHVSRQILYLILISHYGQFTVMS